MKNYYDSKPYQLLFVSLLAILSCFMCGANPSLAQSINLSDLEKNSTEKVEPKVPMPAICIDDGTLITGSYCQDANCNAGLSGNCPSTGGVFMCVSTNLGALGILNSACDGSGSCDAHNCQFVHIRNVTSCCDEIDKITITITKFSTNAKFVICHPVTQWGTNCCGSDWRPEWTIADNSTSPSTQLNSTACNSWGTTTTRDIEFNIPNAGTNPDFRVEGRYHWSVIICGATITNIKLHWVGTGGNGNTNFANPTVNTTQCPDAGGNHNWAGCP